MLIRVDPVLGHHSPIGYTQKKVGTLPVAGDPEAVKQTNEIGMAIPLLDAIDLTACPWTQPPPEESESATNRH
ncbi:MAG: hypothetical protein ACREWG_14565 [Gammaproteobacteria bacterium]